MYDESVQCVKNVDLTKGFSSWHIKWAIIITRDDLHDNKSSPYFKLPLTADKADNSKLKSYLSILFTKGTLDYTEDTEISFTISVYREGYSVQFLDPLMIYRFGLSNDDQEVVLFNSHMGGDVDNYVNIDSSLLKPDSHPIVHCWLDIPTAIIKKIKESDEDSLCRNIEVPWNISNFLKKSEELYKSVIGENQKSVHSDITLVLKKSIKSNGIFHCHRLILADASPMFATMFSMNQWKEGEDGTVDIDDVDEDTMKAVLYHVYTGQFKKSEPSNLPNLVYAADKYQLKDLKAWAEIQLMAAEYTDSERIDCLVFAERHQLRQLHAVCIRMLSTNVRLLASDEFKENLSKELWEEVIKAAEKRQVNAMQINVEN